MAQSSITQHARRGSGTTELQYSWLGAEEAAVPSIHCLWGWVSPRHCAVQRNLLHPPVKPAALPTQPPRLPYVPSYKLSVVFLNSENCSPVVTAPNVVNFVLIWLATHFPYWCHCKDKYTQLLRLTTASGGGTFHHSRTAGCTVTTGSTAHLCETFHP